MRHTLPLATQFYVTASQPCPYLKGKTERKLFAALQGMHAELLNNTLSKQGFRRSQNVLYRPSCADCNACLSARIRVADFQPSRSQKRILRKNKNVVRNITAPIATEHQYNLFKRYLTARHSAGGMADMDMFEFSSMIEETTVNSKIIEYSVKNTSEACSKPFAVCLTDILDDGLSLVYSFFDPKIEKYSPGYYMILDHINIAHKADLPYVYLGYWIQGSAKMDYKSRFNALEIFYQGVWRSLDNPAKFVRTDPVMGTDPISEQVAAITLPDILS